MDLDFWDCFGSNNNSSLQPKKYGMQHQTCPPALAPAELYFQNDSNMNSIIPKDLYYRISSDIRWIFSFQNNPKDLDLSYKTDLDL